LTALAAMRYSCDFLFASTVVGHSMHPDEIKELIENGLKDATAQVTGDDGVHFEAVVISPEFSTRNRIQKQQLVYATLGNRIADGTIHAISIKTYTPDEWNSHKNL
jgi:acid stress-induced BolA-like protein IbaG/YrbA